MKLVSLNTWGGNRFEALITFVKEQSANTDVFCFQEILDTALADHDKIDFSLGDTIFYELQKALPDYVGYHAVTHEKFNWRPVEFDLKFGNAIFVRKDIPVLNTEHSFVHRAKNEAYLPELLQKNWHSLPRLVQSIQIPDDSGIPVTIFNFHGLWHSEGKGDMESRDAQSDKIIEFLSKTSGRKILCGDFNMNIDASCLKRIEDELNMRNLIREFDIKTTRSKELYPRFERMPYADYTLVSNDIEVQNFAVPDLPISDHLPMILEFK